jgi:hypothetical protein
VAVLAVVALLLLQFLSRPRPVAAMGQGEGEAPLSTLS